METTEHLEDLTDPSGYDSCPEYRRNGKTELYRTIPPDLLGGNEAPHPMLGIYANWKVIMDFYKTSEKEFLQKIDVKTTEIDSLRQGVSPT